MRQFAARASNASATLQIEFSTKEGKPNLPGRNAERAARRRANLENERIKPPLPAGRDLSKPQEYARSSASLDGRAAGNKGLLALVNYGQQTNQEIPPRAGRQEKIPFPARQPQGAPKRKRWCGRRFHSPPSLPFITPAWPPHGRELFPQPFPHTGQSGTGV